MKIVQELPETKKDLGPSKAVSSFVKGGIGLLTTAVVDMVAAFSTAYWATWNKVGDQTVHYGGFGLWKIWECSSLETDQTQEELHRKMSSESSGTGCEAKMAGWLNFPGWYVTVQVLETLGLAGLLAALLMLLLYAFLPTCSRSRLLMSSLIALSYLAGLFIMVGLFIFGFKVAEDIEERRPSDWFLSWSFSLACTSFVLNQIAASILVTENKRLFKDDQMVEKAKQLYPGIKEELQAVLAHPT